MSAWGVSAGGEEVSAWESVCPDGCLSRGCLPRGEVSALGGVCLGGCMSQGLLGLCCLIETRDHIEIITITAVLFE